jgi:hypothetical protein
LMHKGSLLRLLDLKPEKRTTILPS